MFQTHCFSHKQPAILIWVTNMSTNRILALLRILCAVSAILSVSSAYGQVAPLADHHQHLFSPATTNVVTSLNPITASDVVSLLYAAGMKRAVVLSVAYMFGGPNRTVENEYDKVKAENDWTSQQVGLFPNRLLGFCSFNPLREYALDELARCARDPRLRASLKLHFGNSVVDLGRDGLVHHNAFHFNQLVAGQRLYHQRGHGSLRRRKSAVAKPPDHSVFKHCAHIFSLFVSGRIHEVPGANLSRGRGPHLNSAGSRPASKGRMRLRRKPLRRPAR